jgi:hypothetical protein
MCLFFSLVFPLLYYLQWLLWLFLGKQPVLLFGRSNPDLTVKLNRSRTWLAQSLYWSIDWSATFRKETDRTDRKEAMFRLLTETWLQVWRSRPILTDKIILCRPSGKGKHQLDEKFRKSIPGSERRGQTSPWWGIQEERTWQRAEKANISLLRNSGRVYLAVSGEGKHQLDEKFEKSIPRSTCCLPACRISGYTNVVSKAFKIKTAWGCLIVKLLIWHFCESSTSNICLFWFC